MFKNIASQKVTVYAFDSTTNTPKTGDAANLTAYVDKDDGGVTVLTDTSATEKDATNAKGYYIFDVAQAETNANKLLFSCKSSTANIVVIAVPAVVFTRPPNFSTFLIDASGNVNGLGAGVITDASIASDSGLKAIRKNTAQAGANGSITFDASASAVDEFYKYDLVSITSGTGSGQAREITAYVGSTKVATVGRNWATNPDATSVFAILPSDVLLGADPLDATGTAAAVWNAVSATYDAAGSKGKKVTDAASAGDPWTTSLPGSYTAGQAGNILGTNLNTTVGSRAVAGDPMTLTSGERNATADAMLNRDLSAVTVTNSRSPINAFRFNRNKFTIDHVTGALTVYKEDDTTVAWTGTITPTASIVTLNVDPA